MMPMNIFCINCRLTFLSIAKIYGISDAAILQVARSSPSLKHLNMQGCWRVTDNAVRYKNLYCKSTKFGVLFNLADLAWGQKLNWLIQVLTWVCQEKLKSGVPHKLPLFRCFWPFLGIWAWIWAYFGGSGLDFDIFLGSSGLDLVLFWWVRPEFWPIWRVRTWIWADFGCITWGKMIELYTIFI